MKPLRITTETQAPAGGRIGVSGPLQDAIPFGIVAAAGIVQEARMGPEVIARPGVMRTLKVKAPPPAGAASMTLARLARDAGEAAGTPHPTLNSPLLAGG